MSTLRMNASKAEARRLADFEGSENDENGPNLKLYSSTYPHGLTKASIA